MTITFKLHLTAFLKKEKSIRKLKSKSACDARWRGTTHTTRTPRLPRAPPPRTGYRGALGLAASWAVGRVCSVLPRLSTAVTSHLHPRSAAARSRGSAWGSRRGRRAWAASVASGHGLSPRRVLDGQSRSKSAALEAASSSSRGGGGAPTGPASSRECRAARSRQARAEEAKRASWGAAKGGTLTMPQHNRR